MCLFGVFLFGILARDGVSFVGFNELFWIDGSNVGGSGEALVVGRGDAEAHVSMFAASQRRGDGFQTAKDFIFEASDGGICRISSDCCERVFVEVSASEVDRLGEERHHGRLVTKQ